MDASHFDVTSECHQSIEIVWRASLGTNIYTNPLIVDLFK